MVSKKVAIMVYRLGMNVPRPEIRAAAEEEHAFWGLGTGEDHQKISEVHFGIAVLVGLQPIVSGV